VRVSPGIVAAPLGNFTMADLQTLRDALQTLRLQVDLLHSREEKPDM
jgi:hypothetical protein